MITIIGTSHIAGESVGKVRRTIRELKPECVAVELDIGRYHALVSGETKRPVKMPIFQKVLFYMLKSVQDKLSKETGIFPGKEMLTAVEEAHAVGARVVLIDRDIRLTLSRLMKQMKTTEKIKLSFFLVLAFLGLERLVLMFDKQAGTKIDLNKVPEKEFVELATSELRNRFPTIYRVLVSERDVHMAGALRYLSQKHENIVAVVGAGHESGINKILARIGKE